MRYVLGAAAVLLSLCFLVIVGFCVYFGYERLMAGPKERKFRDSALIGEAERKEAQTGSSLDMIVKLIGIRDAGQGVTAAVQKGWGGGSPPADRQASAGASSSRGARTGAGSRRTSLSSNLTGHYAQEETRAIALANADKAYQEYSQKDPGMAGVIKNLLLSIANMPLGPPVLSGDYRSEAPQRALSPQERKAFRAKEDAKIIARLEEERRYYGGGDPAPLDLGPMREAPPGEAEEEEEYE